VREREREKNTRCFSPAALTHESLRAIERSLSLSFSLFLWQLSSPSAIANTAIDDGSRRFLRDLREKRATSASLAARMSTRRGGGVLRFGEIKIESVIAFDRLVTFLLSPLKETRVGTTDVGSIRINDRRERVKVIRARRQRGRRLIRGRS